MTEAEARKPGIRARARYLFDSAMSRGTGIVILWLGAITVGLVFVAALVLTVFRIGVNEDKTPSLLERFWQSLLRILDPGTFSGDAGWPLRVTMLLVTLLGRLRPRVEVRVAHLHERDPGPRASAPASPRSSAP